MPLKTRLKWRSRRLRILYSLTNTKTDHVSVTASYVPEAAPHFVTVQISHAQCTLESSHPSLKGDLNLPVAGQTVTGHVFDISGWALEQGSPLNAVEVWWGNEILCETQLDPERREPLNVYPAAPDSHQGGFRVPVNTLLLPEAFELQIYATRHDGSKEKISEVSGKRSAVAPSDVSKLQPLTLIGLPRSGTTLLMNYLSNHPAIVAYKGYPYEFTALSYWLHCFRVLGTPSDFAHSSQPNTYLSNPYFIGHHPYFAPGFGAKVELWFQQEYVSNLLTFCLHSIESCYQQIAAAENKRDPEYFAEKLHRPTATYHLQWSLYPQSRSIFIVRDFRDRYCSARTFSTRFGIYFDQDDLDAELDFIIQTRKEFMLCYNIWKRNPERVHLVRYEDLVLRPRETIAKLFEQMDLQIDGILLDKLLADTTQDTQEYSEHRTAKSDAGSIGRWKTELNPQQKELYRTHFGDVLSEFGYEL